ncbi:MAG: hypothetical protein OEY67_02320 [Gammaproteobacteria bacterium]|nr:hypothetical protein [Gammaproteobacteria bacterium]
MQNSETPTIQKVIAILWPSFLMSGVATTFFFTAFDPAMLLLDTAFAELSRLGAYSIGFFLFWLLTAASCVLTCYFQRPCLFKNQPSQQLQ